MEEDSMFWMSYDSSWQNIEIFAIDYYLKLLEWLRNLMYSKYEIRTVFWLTTDLTWSVPYEKPFSEAFGVTKLWRAKFNFVYNCGGKYSQVTSSPVFFL